MRELCNFYICAIQTGLFNSICNATERMKYENCWSARQQWQKRHSTSVGSINKRRKLMIELKIKGHRTRCLFTNSTACSFVAYGRQKRALTWAEKAVGIKNTASDSLRKKSMKIISLMPKKFEWIIFWISCLINIFSRIQNSDEAARVSSLEMITALNCH